MTQRVWHLNMQVHCKQSSQPRKGLRAVSLRLMTSQFKDIINDKQKYVHKMHILQCMGWKFCVKFQRRLLKFHTKFWTHTLQNMHLRGVKNLTNHDILNLCETGPRCLHAASSFSQALALENSEGGKLGANAYISFWKICMHVQGQMDGRSP